MDMDKQKYTMILADDEEEVRNRIASKIPLDSGFEIIGLASNGYDALELVEKLSPDVVLTDIRMPFIDGMELARRLRIEHPKTKVAFISGFDEFSYAKKAIELNVVSYLTKPISDSEVQIFLTRLREILDQDKESTFNQERLDLLFQSNLPAMIEHQFNTLLRLPEIKQSDLEKFKVYGIDLQGGNIIGIIEIDEEELLKMEQLRIFLMNLFNTRAPKGIHPIFFNSQFGFVFILQADKIQENEIESYLNGILVTKEDFSDAKVKIGISEVFDDFTRFQISMLQAKKALSYGNYLHIGDLIFYRDIKTRKKADLVLTKEESDEISYTIKFESSKSIHNLFSSLEKRYGLNEGYLLNKRYFIISLTNIFLEFAKSLSVEIDEVIKEDLFDVLSRFDQLHELFTYLSELTFQIRNHNIENSQSHANVILNEAVQFLDVHYSDPNISMEMVTEKLNISISYLAMLFKKILDTTFNKYLVKIRMEKAMELLKFSQDKILNIASAVGYNDVYYFSFSFKKYTSMSPKEYRNDQKN